MPVFTLDELKSLIAESNNLSLFDNAKDLKVPVIYQDLVSTPTFRKFTDFIKKTDLGKIHIIIVSTSVYKLRNLFKNAEYISDETFHTPEQGIALMQGYVDDMKDLLSYDNQKILLQWSYRPTKGRYSRTKLVYAIDRIKALYMQDKFAALGFIMQLGNEVSVSYNPWQAIDYLFKGTFADKVAYYEVYLRFSNAYELIKYLEKGVFILMLAKKGIPLAKISSRLGFNTYFINNLVKILQSHPKVSLELLIKIYETLLNVEYNTRIGRVPTIEEAFWGGLIKIHSMLPV